MLALFVIFYRKSEGNNMSYIEILKNDLRNFDFEKAFSKSVSLMELLLSNSLPEEQEELFQIITLYNEAMEIRDVIRMCDILDYIIKPEFEKRNMSLEDSNV
ncbi:MAG: hypothetical protein K0Q99_1135 [Clostridia bacterium]|jgi:hypothetical protein|nr:hypothetical protein [Clostridia bacterium]